MGWIYSCSEMKSISCVIRKILQKYKNMAYWPCRERPFVRRWMWRVAETLSRATTMAFDHVIDDSRYCAVTGSVDGVKKKSNIIRVTVPSAVVATLNKKGKRSSGKSSATVCRENSRTPRRFGLAGGCAGSRETLACTMIRLPGRGGGQTSPSA